MLGNCSKGQPVAYNILKNAIANKTVAHSYLFHADNNAIAFDFALSFAKTLICPEQKLDDDVCNDCIICHRIDKDNFPELRIIKPDGLWIKKEQLLTLQEEFRMKPLEGNKKIYIINGADKLNVQAANSILKFLEEPEANIIALLTTDDVRKVLPTIVSRCQLISLRNNFENIDLKLNDGIGSQTMAKLGNIYYQNLPDIQQFVNNEKNIEKVETIVSFVKKYEALGYDVLLETKKLWSDFFTEKEDNIWAFDIMALLYRDVLNVMYGEKSKIFDDYNDVIEFIVSNNEAHAIIHKLQKIMEARDKIKYNINSNLLLDKLIIEMESGEHI